MDSDRPAPDAITIGKASECSPNGDDIPVSTSVDSIPFYDHKLQGWVAPEWKKQPPKIPRQHPHSPGSSGWVLGNYWPESIGGLEQNGLPFNDRDGFVIEDWEPPVNGSKERLSKTSRSRHHGGRKGWYAENWVPTFEERLADHLQKSKGLIRKSGKFLGYMHPSTCLIADAVVTGPGLSPSQFNPPSSVTHGEQTIVVEIELPGVPEDHVRLELIRQQTQSIDLKTKSAGSSQDGACFLSVWGVKPQRWVCVLCVVSSSGS